MIIRCLNNSQLALKSYAPNYHMYANSEIMSEVNKMTEGNDNNRIFNQQNWSKAKWSIKDIRSAIRTHLGLLKIIPGGKDIIDNLNITLKLIDEDYKARWTAD